MISTNYTENSVQKKGGFTARTWYAIILGFGAGAITCTLLQVTNTVLWCLTVFSFMAVPAMISAYLYSGSFPHEKIEQVQLKVARRSRTLKTSFDGPEISGHWAGVSGYDKDSVYTIGGDEFMGWEVQGVTQEALRSISQNLHKRLPTGCSLIYMRYAEPFVTDFLKEHRPALLEKNVMGVEYYLIAKFPYLKAGEEKRKEFLDEIPSGFFRMTRESLRHLTERIVDPYKRNSEGDSPVYEASYVSDGRYAFPYPDECYAAIAMTALGKKVDHRFVDVFKPAFGMRSVISTTITKQSATRQTFKGLYSAAREAGKIGIGKLTGAEKRAIRKAEEDESEGLFAPMEIYCQALVYGQPSKANEVIKSIKEGRHVPDVIRPLMSPELGNIRAALRAITPGAMGTIPTRVLKVTSLVEASYYLPRYAPATNQQLEHRFVLRTVHNTPAYINHAGLSETPLTIFAGKSGSGKSSLMALEIRAHWLLGELDSRPVAVVVGDVGGSMTFMIENGIADLAFNMERLNGEDFPSLPIHPLHVFLERDGAGEVKQAQRYLAREMLAFLMRVNTSDSDVTKVLDEALDMMIKSETVYRLSTFAAYMRKAADAYIESAPAEARAELGKVWFERATRLSLFTKDGKSYGRIFDPDTVQRDSMKGVVNFYYNCDEEIFQIPDLATAYIGLCWSVARSIGQRFKSTNEESRDTLLLMDEFDRKSPYLGGLTLKDMKDQSRKYGIIPGLGIQSFDYLTMPDSKENSGRSKNTIYEGVGNTFFYGVGHEDVYPKVAAIFEESHIPGTKPRGKVAEMIEIADFIKQSKEEADKEKNLKQREGMPKKERVYSVGFFDSSRQIQHLYVDIERDFLWMFTTHPGGRAIRAAVRKRFPNDSLIKVSRLLADHGPWPIPSETPAQHDINAVVERVAYARED